jgi:hypothetical protein
MRQAGRDAKLIDGKVRRDKRANALFLDLLCGRKDPETALRWMNEAGVFGRFVPDFGRVNAQMQFDMYHHYTVDEHTIRAIGLLSQIERGLLTADHPRATREFPKLASRRALYVAVSDAEEYARFIKGEKPAAGYALVAPEPYGRHAMPMLTIGGETKPESVRKQLIAALALYNPPPKDSEKHEAEGLKAGIQWKPKTPITDRSRGQRGRARRRP